MYEKCSLSECHKRFISRVYEQDVFTTKITWCDIRYWLFAEHRTNKLVLNWLFYLFILFYFI